MDTPLAALRRLTAISDAELSRRSGTSRSTIHRIDAGTVHPTLRTLRELAIAAGLDIDVTYRPLSDPAAGRAARFLLDEAFTTVAKTADDDDWIDRIERLAPAGDPIAIVTESGRATDLRHRAGAIHLKNTVAPLRLASAGDATGHDWAISGRAALDAINDTDVPTGSGPDVLYVTDPQRAWRLLDAPERAEAAEAALIIAPLLEEHSIDAWEHDRAHFVAPIQILLDGIGFGGELANTARHVAESW
ncbi:MAG: helix-turn-helix domain-containing protein [Microcella sp.]